MKRYLCKTSSFNHLPGNIFCYWASKQIIGHFEHSEKLSSKGNAKQGLSTSDNNRFLRLWYEIKFGSINFHAKNTADASSSHFKWFPYNKAGTFRKWSSIDEYVVNYGDDGRDIKKLVMKKYPYLNSPDFVVKNTESYFKEGISWNDVSTGMFSCRYIPEGYIFADVAPTFFSSEPLLYLGYFNSNSFQQFADIICQGLHYSTGHIPEIPFVYPINELREEIKELVSINIKLSNKDRDSIETSWCFKRNPLI